MAQQATASPQGAAESTGTFVYAVVPADVEPTRDAQGLGDPPDRIKMVTHGEIGALVSEVGLDRPLGRPEDLLAYERLLDGTAAVAPVLPVRFGVVLTGPDAVEDLLTTHHDELKAALDEFEGRMEFAVRGRYVERAVIREVLEENEEAATLREHLRGQPEEATVNMRIRLGEIINQAFEAKRAADTQRVVDVLAPVSVKTMVRPPTHEEDAANVAFLVETDQQEKFDEALDALAKEWKDRVTLRRLGPLAPYDFVEPLQAGG